MAKNNQKTLRHRPSKKLERLIQLVNGLPPSVKSWEEIVLSAKELAGKPLKEFGRGLYIFGLPNPDRPILSLETEIMLFTDHVKKLRTPAREYVGPMNLETAITLAFEEPYPMKGYDVEQTMHAALIRYERLIHARKILEEIAEKGASVDGYRRFHSQTGKWPYTSLLSTFLSPFPDINVSLHIDQQGQIAIKPDELLDALLGAEAERIRQCPICNSIFWAGRIDQKGCSKQCANIIRVHRCRELAKDRAGQYKIARIEKAEKRERKQPVKASNVAGGKMPKQNKRKRDK